MTLTELRYLVNLDQERHFGRAAERSFVSQPTLSLALKKLEDELGVLLFERASGQARPTAAGARIIAQARRVLAEAQAVKELAREGQDELAGPLRLGAIYTVGPYLLPRLVPKLRKSAPQMPLMIEENFTSVLLTQLRDHELDVALLALPIHDEQMLTWPLYQENFVVLMPRGHRLEKLKQVPAKKLAEESLLLLGPGHCFREQVVAACPKCVEPDDGLAHPITGSSLETIRQMVASGLGITVLPQSSVENRPDDPLLSYRPFLPPAPSRQIGLVWRKSFPRTQAIAALQQAIKTCGMRGVKLRDADPP